MKAPHMLIGDSYSGPSKMHLLGDLPNQEGFRFIGIDHFGNTHKCDVRKDSIGCHGVYRTDTNEPFFCNLVGWLQDA